MKARSSSEATTPHQSASATMVRRCRSRPSRKPSQSIRTEVDEAGQHRQLLRQFAEVEREQFERDHDELQRRLAAIPGEIEAKTKRIRGRFEDPRPLLFPVSATWLLPLGGER